MSGPATRFVRARICGGMFEVDEQNLLLTKQGQTDPLKVEALPLRLLCLLIRNNGKLVSYDAIKNHMGCRYEAANPNVTNAVSKLRRVLDQLDPHEKPIITVPGEGLRFDSDVEWLSENDPVYASEDPAQIDVSSAARLPIQKYVDDFSRRIDHADSIVGRDTLVGRIEALINDGSPRKTIWVRGEPGIGKTGLLEKFVRSHPDCLRHFIWRMGGENDPKTCLRNLCAQLTSANLGYSFPDELLPTDLGKLDIDG